MNKTELISKVAEKVNITKKDSEAIVGAVFETIADALAEGDKVQLIGFGTFETRKRAARNGRNPQTGETVTIPESTVPAFKAGKSLREQIGVGQ